MNLAETLKEFEQLTNEGRTLLEKEILEQQRGNEPDEDFYETKRELIAKLDKQLKSLKVASEGLEEAPRELSQQLSRLQQKFMQVLRLDRELEKLLLAGTQSSAGEFHHQFKGAMLNRAYSSSANH